MGHSAMTGSFRGASNFPSRPPPQTQLPPTPKGPRFRMFVGSDGLRVYDDGRVAQVSVTSIICGDGRVGTTTNFKHGSHVESMVDLEITPGGHRLVTVYHDSVPQSEVVVPPRMMNAYSSMSNAFPSDTRSQDGYHRGRGDGTSYSPLRPEVVVEEDDDLVTYY
ncbi:hypothetical protein BCR39DRAFT_539410 [Naematelia encephala]|uniref:Uncharacterized protein n=1 Tax=Naematelia encephala TaxID=71784 RepID=A0A1Y2AWK9_9TREE|nr:hypothetical protein BCR39DRAFT_539410 [Naematelia encephala]